MLTIEILAIDENGWDHAAVIHRIDQPGSGINVADRAAKRIMSSGQYPSCNGYQIKDEKGDVVLRFRESEKEY